MKRYRQIICPCCGHAAGRRSRLRVKHIKYDIQDYWQRLEDEFEEDRDYFAVEQDTGKLGFKNTSFLSPSDWPEGFDLIRQALFRALRHYLTKKWISRDEVLRLIS